MSEPLFKGVLTALVTPFRDDKIDEEAFRRLVERQIKDGVHGVVPVGTTGETATLSPDEHKRVVELCVEIVAGRVSVIAGAGSNATAEAIDFVRHAKAVGADGALVVTPYYNRPSQEGMYQHYAAIDAAVDFPVIVYNVPSRTGSDIANDTLARLAKLKSIRGVKDATGDLGRASLMRLQCGPDFCMLSGDDPTAVGYIAHGGHGLISVTSNVAPKASAERMNAAMAGDFKTALAWQDKLIKLDKALFSDASPSPTKFALAELGLCAEDLRLPITPCGDTVKPSIRDALQAVGGLRS
jgi:4-hydroxy-tetrahydrodipicolinate synthase